MLGACTPPKCRTSPRPPASLRRWAPCGAVALYLLIGTEKVSKVNSYPFDSDHSGHCARVHPAWMAEERVHRPSHDIWNHDCACVWVAWAARLHGCMDIWNHEEADTPMTVVSDIREP